MRQEVKAISAEYITCPIRNVISRFSDKWSMLVLYLLYKDEKEVMRFSELHRQMIDCSQKMLSQTLKKLEKDHLVSRRLYAEVPPRVEYSLTDTGKTLMPSLEGLIMWAKENFSNVVTD